MPSPYGSAALIADMDGKVRGSAFRISRNLFLTAAHIVAEMEDSLQIRTLGSDDFAEFTIVWRGDVEKSEYALALLRVAIKDNDESSAPFPEVSFGRFIGDGLRKCEVTGFSRSWDHQSTEAIAARITGNVDPGEYPESSLLMFEPSRPVLEWQGVGGSGLCCQGALVGILTAYHRERGFFLVVPVTALVANSAFRNALRKELRHEVDIVSIQPPEIGVSEALKDISRANPSNILEVAAAQFKLSDQYYENVLSQARRSFNAAVVAAITGTLFFLAAIVFALVSKELTAALVSAIGGGVVEVVSGLNFWLYARTSIQLNAFHIRLERMQRYLVANSVAASLSDEGKESALGKLVMTIADNEHSND